MKYYMQLICQYYTYMLEFRSTTEAIGTIL